jgi:hypothetical protein
VSRLDRPLPNRSPLDICFGEIIFFVNPDRHWALKTSFEMFAYFDFLIARFLHSLAIAISERRDNHDYQKIE